MPLVDIESMPVDLQEEFVAAERNIPSHIWEKYSNERKGQLMAASIVKSRLNTIERFYRELDYAKQQNRGSPKNKK